MGAAPGPGKARVDRAGRVDHPSRAERMATGRACREAVPRRSHASLGPQAQHRDPVELLEQQAANRIPELLPIRYGRMLASSFAFYRGATVLMAADLAEVPRDELAGATVRGRPPLQLRWVRRARSAARLQCQRLRRDVAGPVRMGPQASRGQLRRRRPSERAEHGGAGDGEPGRRRCVSPGDEGLRPDANARHVVRPPRRRPVSAVSGTPVRRRRRRGASSGAWRSPASRTALRALDRLTRLVDGEPRIISDPPLVVPIRRAAR